MHMTAYLKCLMGIIFLMSHATSYAVNPTAFEEQANITIKELYHTLNAMPNISMPNRIDWISQSFLGTIYELGALGEGAEGRYDQYPKYRVDAFDCDTFVNTVLSLALANSLKSFKTCQNLNRYKSGMVSYKNRNHFMSLDWDINNQKRGILQDITRNIKDKNQHSVALLAKTTINKPNWYAFKKLNTIRVTHADTQKKRELLAELKKEGSQLEVASVTTPYIPLTALFNKKNTPNSLLFSQIPHGAIIQIVRPDWDLRNSIGTSLNISHLGFAIRKHGVLYFRQASSQKGKVVDVLMSDYLKEAQASPTIKGINLQIVVPKKGGVCQL